MRSKILWMWGLVMITSLVAVQRSYADEAAIQSEINQLKARISELEVQLVRIEQPEAPKPTPVTGEKPGLRIGGMGIFSANYNANEPNNQRNTFHEFDAVANTMQIDAFELIIQQESHGEKPVGFRADLLVGETAESIGSTGTIVDDVDLQQAYVSWKPSIFGKELDIWAGKYVTLAGAEVIPDPSGYNWNITRSFMFYYSIPFTHTGIRSMIPVVDKLTAYLGVNNGWDMMEDTNDAKTLETALSITPWDWLSVFSSFYYGQEGAAGAAADKRNVWSTVTTLKSPWDNEILNRLTLMFNYDLGHDEKEGTAGGGLSSNWDGLASYARYMITDKLGLSLRHEFFNDSDGARTASASGIVAPRPNAAAYLQEVSVTLDYPFYDECIGRVEYRHDWAHDRFFNDENKRVKDQDILSAQLIHLF